MAGGILNALMANPRGWGMSGPSLQEPEVAYQDDAGNLYGFNGEKIRGWTLPADPMGIYDVATAPAKFATSLAEGFSPYGQKEDGDTGFRVPPIIQEPVNALSRLAENSRLPDGSLGIPEPRNPDNQRDVTTGILSLYGGNAFSRGVRGMRAVPRGAPDLSLLEQYHLENRLPPVSESVPRNRQAILDDVLTGADYALPAASHPMFDPPPMSDVLRSGAANDVPFGGIHDANVPDSYRNALADQWRRNFRPDLGVIDGGLLSDTGKPSLMGSALAAGSKGVPAYHISTQAFDKFDESKAGTGGGDLFGPGIYFTRSKDQLADWRNGYLADGKKSYDYEVRLDVDENRLVDWNKPVGDQTEVVRKAIDPYGTMADATIDELVGGLSLAELKAAFKDMGLDGVRVVDPEDPVAEHIIVYDRDKINIVSRDGKRVGKNTSTGLHGLMDLLRD